MLSETSKLALTLRPMRHYIIVITFNLVKSLTETAWRTEFEVKGNLMRVGYIVHVQNQATNTQQVIVVYFD